MNKMNEKLKHSILFKNKIREERENPHTNILCGDFHRPEAEEYNLEIHKW